MVVVKLRATGTGKCKSIEQIHKRLFQVGNIVKALHRQMKEKSIKTRQGCFALLTELILVLPGALAAHMNLLVPGVQFSLASSQSNSNMKIDTLSFVQVSSNK